MMRLKSKIFLVFGVIPTFFVTILTIFYLINHFETQLFSSLFYGYLITTINFFLGYFSIKYGLEGSDKIFLLVVFGGLIARLFIMLILIILALKLLFVSRNSFIFTTFIFYFYYLIVEIFILTRKKNFYIKPSND